MSSENKSDMKELPSVIHVNEFSTTEQERQDKILKMCAEKCAEYKDTPSFVQSNLSSPEVLLSTILKRFNNETNRVHKLMYAEMIWRLDLLEPEAQDFLDMEANCVRGAVKLAKEQSLEREKFCQKCPPEHRDFFIKILMAQTNGKDQE